MAILFEYLNICTHKFGKILTDAVLYINLYTGCLFHALIRHKNLIKNLPKSIPKVEHLCSLCKKKDRVALLMTDPSLTSYYTLD